MTPGVPLEK